MLREVFAQKSRTEAMSIDVTHVYRRRCRAQRYYYNVSRRDMTAKMPFTYLLEEVAATSDSARSSKYTATSSSVVNPSRFFSDSQRLRFVTPMCMLRKCFAVATFETAVVVVAVGAAAAVRPGSTTQPSCSC